MVKHVLQAVPIYLMFVFKIPSGVLQKMSTIIRRFLWQSDLGHGVFWKKWDSLCLTKNEGGLGFQELGAFNQALLARQAWQVLSNPSSLFASVLLGKYSFGKTFLNILCAKAASWGWKSLMWGRELLKEGLIWRVGNGQSIKPFEDLWIPGQINPVRGMELSNFFPEIRVAHLIDFPNNCWRGDLFSWLFPTEVVPLILGIYIPLVSCPDRLVWTSTTNGIFSVKSGYWSAIKRHAGTPSANTVDTLVWKKLWKLNLPSKLSLFLWKCLHNILLVKWQLRKRGIPIDTICARCGQSEETREHVFFECQWSQRVWRGTTLGLNFSISQPVGFNIW